MFKFNGPGPVYRAVMATIKTRIEAAEAEYKTKQAALVKEFEVREEELLAETVKTLLSREPE